MVKDIYPGNDYPMQSLDPWCVSANIGNKLFFKGTQNGDAELWISDGTDSGTTQLLDINPLGDSQPDFLTNFGAGILFTANDGVHGQELWKTDGTETGTVLVKDIFPGIDGSFPKNFMVSAGVCYFFANNDNGISLWKTDGTEAGTVLLYENISIGSSFDYVVINSVVYFLAVGNNLTGQELWRTDGTNAGTYMVKDINAGSGNSDIVKLVVYQSVLYFGAKSTAYGNELWRSDGTPGGTYLVKDINVGSADSQINCFAVLNSGLYFSASDGTGKDLWKTDGTSDGTVKVKDFSIGSSGAIPLNGLNNFTVMGANLYFSKSDGKELWRSDGTEVGTVMIKSFDIEPNGFFDGIGYTFKVIGSNLLFAASDGFNGNELWKTDGTESGTMMVKDIFFGYGGSLSRVSCHVISSTLYFSANDGINGRELWKTDGTELGTVMIKNLIGSNINSSMLVYSEYGKINNTLFFIATDGVHGMELWKSDGTAAGTSMVKDITVGPATSYIRGLCTMGSNLYFFVSDQEPVLTSTRWRLWKTDGTTAGTVFIKEMPYADTSSVMAAGSTIYFVVNSGATRLKKELWKSDGTSEGTVKIKDFTANWGSEVMLKFWDALGNKLFFTVDSNTSIAGPWITDGTEAGTIQLSATVLVKHAVQMGDYIYFMSVYNPSLWKSDGTVAGTVLVKALGNDTGYRSTPMKVLGNTLFFKFSNAQYGNEIWKSDGTAAGTVILKDINPGPGSSGLNDDTFTVFNSKLYFMVNMSDSTGDHFWQTDGTEAGTVIVSDSIVPYYWSNLSQYLCVSGSRMYFSTYVDPFNLDFWTFDGTNFSKIADLTAYPLIDVNGKLFFKSKKGNYGQELWSLGDCGPANPIVANLGVNTQFNAQRQDTPQTKTCFCDINNNLMATVDAIGSNPVSVQIDIETQIDEFQPADHVRRYTSIIPHNNFDINTATARVTLYFTQQDFDSFNAVNPVAPLPTNGFDTFGKSNARIYRYGQSVWEVINPLDNDIVWNATLNRWEITFDTIGLGTYVLFTNATLLSQQEFDEFALSYYPNPTNGMFYLEFKKPVDSLILYDMIGNKIYESTLVQKQTILHMEQYNPGVYILIVKSQGKTQNIKVVKK